MTLETTKAHKGKTWGCETSFDTALFAGDIEMFDEEDRTFAFSYTPQELPELSPPKRYEHI